MSDQSAGTLSRRSAFGLAVGMAGELAVKAEATLSAEGDTVPFRAVPEVRQLFLDDAGVFRLSRVRRTVHPPEKRGAVLRSPDARNTVQTRTAPIWDPERGRYLLFVLSIEPKLWESSDGLHWAPGPSPDMPVDLVVRDPNDPDPLRRFKAALVNAGFAVSPDGVHWTKLDTPRVPSSDEANLSFDASHGLFIHSVKRRGKFGRSVAVATSQDFRTWKDYGLVFEADDADQPLGRRRIRARLSDHSLQRPEYDVPEQYSTQIYNMGMFHYEGLYVGMPSVFHQTGRHPKEWPGFDLLRLSPAMKDAVKQYGDWTGFHHVQLAVSRDFAHWTRVADRTPWLENSPLGAGAYDTQTLIGPSAPVVRGDELWFYYTGIKQYAMTKSGADPGCEDYVPDKGAICLAVLRRDGFVSLDAGDAEGVVTTRDFALEGTQVRVNLAAAKGQATAELLGAEGRILTRSRPLSGDGTNLLLEWEDAGLAPLLGKRLSLRFRMRNASLLSWWQSR
jgi:hypothetical protein